MRSKPRCLAKVVVFTPVAAWHCHVLPATIAVNRDSSFDSAWRFLRAAVPGADKLAAAGSSAPSDASSFRVPLRKIYQGRCLAILRRTDEAGKITLTAKADGLKPATIVLPTR